MATTFFLFCFYRYFRMEFSVVPWKIMQLNAIAVMMTKMCWNTITLQIGAGFLAEVRAKLIIIIIEYLKNFHIIYLFIKSILPNSGKMELIPLRCVSVPFQRRAYSDFNAEIQLHD